MKYEEVKLEIINEFKAMWENPEILPAFKYVITAMAVLVTFCFLVSGYVFYHCIPFLFKVYILKKEPTSAELEKLERRMR